MLHLAIPKLPMRNKAATKSYYINQLGFKEVNDYGDYLLLEKDQIELHFFAHPTLIPEENDGQIYCRVSEINAWYQELLDKQVAIHPNGKLENKPWQQREFSLLDPDNNLLTFGEPIS
ncbi:MAG TPA: glyoxalase/bleomycin resistance/extradiol dioxygenase family protein [Chitinophagaceae bacterium]|nr:glyoxalase/bleomycin resistance/extradiol dioxygenase family protein [Chitinophagaceae bacterium]HCT24542.1 glyoxalase/bleomycin resistance/extradiol dioxygenase family protein [Chitinophagaceae bacterium]